MVTEKIPEITIDFSTNSRGLGSITLAFEFGRFLANKGYTNVSVRSKQPINYPSIEHQKEIDPNWLEDRKDIKITINEVKDDGITINCFNHHIEKE